MCPASSPISREHVIVGWDQVRSSYDRVAGKYEARFLGELSGKPRDRELLDAFATAVGDPVVEVGCGPGQIGAYVRAHRRRVVGADISVAMATRVRRRLDAAIVANMQSLPLATGAAAGLLAFYSLIHIRRRDVDGVLREFARVLRPGGRVLFSVHEGQGETEVEEFLGEAVGVSVTFFDLDELVAATRAAGFEIVFAERRAPYASESETFRLYIEATRPASAS
jgi:ubiquinone/menaquinone biosynthesis C-methylase UbiE